MRIILASASPRRRRLLAQLGVHFEIIVPNIDEREYLQRVGVGPFSLTQCAEIVIRLAVAKAEQISFTLEEQPAIVIAADTLVVLNGKILGKPANRAHARRMLRALSGNVHQVLTGVAVLKYPGPFNQVTTALTSVKFRALPDALIDAYIRTGEPMGKAGGYAIQERGAALVEAIEGCYYNVVGLPLHNLTRLLEDMKYPVWSAW